MHRQPKQNLHLQRHQAFAARAVLFAAACICAALAAAGQPGMFHYTVKDGLPSSVVYNCTQDDKGFIWFATESGISRFDGANFKNYDVKDGLTDNDVLEIGGAGDGKIWAIPFTKNPVYFDPAIRRFKTTREDTLLKEIIHGGTLLLKPSRRGGMYLFYKGSPGFYHYYNNRLTNLSSRLGKGYCMNIYEPDDERSFFCFIDTIIVQQHRTGQLTVWATPKNTFTGGWADTLLSFNNNSSHSYATLCLWKMDGNRALTTVKTLHLPDNIRHISITPGRIYVALIKGGVMVFSHNLQLLDVLLKEHMVNSSFSDREGNIWFNTYTAGVYFLPVQKVTTLGQAAGDAPGGNISAILPLSADTILTGNMTGILFYSGPQSGIQQTLQRAESTPQGRVRRIRYGLNGGVSFLTDPELFTSDARSPFRFKKLHFLIAARVGSMKDFFEYMPEQYLIATHNTVIKVNAALHTVDTVYHGRSTTVAAGKNGDAWFGTINGLFYMPAINKREYHPVDITPGDESIRISSITEDRAGYLWVATASRGILVLKNNKVIHHLGLAQGLASDICRRLYYDAATGDIWAATNNGISQVKYQPAGAGITASVINYNTTSGLPENDVTDVYVHQNRVYAATTGGAAIFSPAPPEQAIPVHIVDVRIENKEEIPAPQYSLPHYQNDIFIQFTGVCFNCGGRLSYQYRMLSGVSDTTWLPAGGNTVTFSSLKPGRYTFEVRVEGGNKITTVQFYLTPPWYSRWWFWALLASALALLVWQVYRIRVRGIARQAALSQKMSQLELQALQAQMNPHFIFNSLNAIQHFIAGNNAAAARTYLGRFSKLMRLFLESSRSKYIPVAQEVELLDLYLGLEQLRFNNRFEYSVRAGASVEPGAEIPSMLVQPFAENAVNHGLLNRLQPGGRIDIEFTTANGVITCTVQDNGVGRKKAGELKAAGGPRHVSRAVQILEERVHTLRQADGVITRIKTEDLSNDDGTPAGTRVVITIREMEINQ